jgi:tripartite-type tricarboxylate transporter receptor subunit TctC
LNLVPRRLAIPPLREIFCWGVMIALASVACAQDFPRRPIRLVTGAPGGGTDTAARLVAQALPASLGQPVIVDNRPSGVIPGDTVAKAAPDGYTLLFEGGSFWLLPLLRKTPFDPIGDFAPISTVSTLTNLLVVHRSLPATNVKELIALAKARAGQLNYASGGAAGSTDLAAQLFRSMAGINIVGILYKGGGPALIGLMTGEVHMMFGTSSAVVPYLKSNKLRALAVTSARPSVLAPGLPTVAESGLPGYESIQLFGIFAPARTSQPIVIRLNQEIVRAINIQTVKDKFLNAGSEVAGSSPEQFAATIRTELARMGGIIKDAGMRDE